MGSHNYNLLPFRILFSAKPPRNFGHLHLVPVYTPPLSSFQAEASRSAYGAFPRVGAVQKSLWAHQKAGQDSKPLSRHLEAIDTRSCCPPTASNTFKPKPKKNTNETPPLLFLPSNLRTISRRRQNFRTPSARRLYASHARGLHARRQVLAVLLNARCPYPP